MPYDPTRTGIIGINRLVPFTATEVGDSTAGSNSNVQQFLDARRKFRGNVGSVAARDSLPNKQPGEWVLVESVSGSPRIDMWDGTVWLPIGGGTSSAPAYSVKTVTASPYTALASDDVIACKRATPGGFVVNLPAAPTPGLQVRVKDAKGDANVNVLTVATTDATLIDGAATLVIDEAYGSRAFIFGDNGEWLVV